MKTGARCQEVPSTQHGNSAKTSALAFPLLPATPCLRPRNRNGLYCLRGTKDRRGVQTSAHEQTRIFPRLPPPTVVNLRLCTNNATVQCSESSPPVSTYNSRNVKPRQLESPDCSDSLFWRMWVRISSMAPRIETHSRFIPVRALGRLRLSPPGVAVIRYARGGPHSLVAT